MIFSKRRTKCRISDEVFLLSTIKEGKRCMTEVLREITTRSKRFIRREKNNIGFLIRKGY